MPMLFKNWWLLALCGVLDAIISIIYFNHAGNGFVLKSTIVFLGKLTLAAGACTIAASLWNFRKSKSWLLVLNGLALVALGLIASGIFGSRISFRTVALLIILMAMSIGVLELRTAWSLHQVRERWFHGSAGVISLGFALAFLLIGFGWTRLNPTSPGQTLLWLGSYFAFAAICMVWLALRLGTVWPTDRHSF